MRFKFGKNWANYAQKNLTDENIQLAKTHIARFIESNTLEGKSFLDIGSGSGIHSLAANRLGASEIYSFDYDLDSVKTTLLSKKIEGDPAHWQVEQGSILDKSFLEKLPSFDIVYSWGVLHHTGDMWLAIRNCATKLKQGGLLYISLYAKEAYPDYERWIDVKRMYNSSGSLRKNYLLAKETIRLLLGKLRNGENIIKYVHSYKEKRGMSFLHDQIDWIGGYPIEFSSKEEVIDFCAKDLGLQLKNISTGEGCSEFLFQKP
jgi:2-polyprenyl-3-methyl-5-hydroxy-6-metoxy-1,4-benzoquinol methylase